MAIPNGVLQVLYFIGGFSVCVLCILMIELSAGMEGDRVPIDFRFHSILGVTFPVILTLGMWIHSPSISSGKLLALGGLLAVTYFGAVGVSRLLLRYSGLTISNPMEQTLD